MKKIYLFIAGAFLILLVITSILLSLVKKPTTETQKNSAFPTSVPQPETTGRPMSPTNNPTQNTNDNSQDLSVSSFDVSGLPPVETKDFKMQFSPRLNKIVVEKKTPEAEQKFIDWANQNSYPQLIGNSEKVLLTDLGKTPHEFNLVLDLFSIFSFSSFGLGGESSTSNSTSNNSPVTNNASNPSASSGQGQSKVYFAQCGDQGSLSLPDGCNLCNAGCGPTTVSMIASSYLGGGNDPKAIVDIYRSKKYLLGCDGSRYSDAHEVLKQLGLKTTDYIVFDKEKSDSVVPQLRKYLSAGWTFFTLASFCEKGCGHYFWITDIDSQGNIFAYDPAYGRYQIPYNENTRYPYPLYRLAFGVKR